jgi:hypothetical protein
MSRNKRNTAIAVIGLVRVKVDLQINTKSTDTVVR